jgi:sodium/hydrogen antiporter
MRWGLAIIAAAVLAVAGVSRRLTGTSVTPAMVFVVIGVVVGPLMIDEVKLNADGATIRTLAEATLTVVLFADASRIKLRVLRREDAVPLRLLGIGLPLTIVVGAILAAVIFTGLKAAEAIVLAIVLAPTDAALGEAVVTEPRLPSRIRQGLNVESGLNDGICVPLLLIALTTANVEEHLSSSHHAVTIVAEEIGYGILGGVVAGVLVARVLAIADRRDLITGAWRQVVPVSGAALAYGVAAPLGGSGFIAAFVAGAVFGGLSSEAVERTAQLNDEIGNLLAGVTFLVFGAVLLGPSLKHVSWELALYAALSLTMVRMLPVAIAMIGSHARPPTIAFLGWFGPRGLASIVFAVIVVEESRLPAANTILLTTYVTIGVSVFAHGITAAPAAKAYARWYESHSGAEMESVPAAAHRTRWGARSGS